MVDLSFVNIYCHDRCTGEGYRRESGHACRQNENGNQSDQARRNDALEHRGNDFLISGGCEVRELLGEEITQRAREIRNHTDQKREGRADDDALIDCLFVTDRVVFMDGLRQTPYTDGGQKDQRDERYRRAVESRAILGAKGNPGQIGIACKLGNIPLNVFMIHKADDHTDDTDDHNDSLNEIREGSRKISAKAEIKSSKGGKGDHNDPAFNAEYDLKERAKTAVNRCRIRNEEDKDQDGRSKLDTDAAISLLEEFRHGLRTKTSSHVSGSFGKHEPSHESAENGVSDTDPHGGKTKRFSELSCVADKDNGGKIGGSVCKGGHPTVQALFACKQKVVDRGGALFRNECNCNHGKRI